MLPLILFVAEERTLLTVHARSLAYLHPLAAVLRRDEVPSRPRVLGVVASRMATEKEASDLKVGQDQRNWLGGWGRELVVNELVLQQAVWPSHPNTNKECTFCLSVKLTPSIRPDPTCECDWLTCVHARSSPYQCICVRLLADAESAQGRHRLAVAASAGGASARAEQLA